MEDLDFTPLAFSFFFFACIVFMQFIKMFTMSRPLGSRLVRELTLLGSFMRQITYILTVRDAFKKEKRYFGTLSQSFRHRLFWAYQDSNILA